MGDEMSKCRRLKRKQGFGITGKDDWYSLVKDATKNQAKRNEKRVQQIEVTVK